MGCVCPLYDIFPFVPVGDPWGYPEGTVAEITVGRRKPQSLDLSEVIIRLFLSSLI